MAVNETAEPERPGRTDGAEASAVEALSPAIPEQRAAVYPTSASGRVCSLFSHVRGRLVLNVIKLGHQRFLNDARPLAAHLEHEVFPLLREDRVAWLDIAVPRDDGADLAAEGGTRTFFFPGTQQVAAYLRHLGVENVRLATQLEAGQVVEAFLILHRAAKALPRTEAEARQLRERRQDGGDYTGWEPRRVAAAMVSPKGYHKFCADMRFDPVDARYEVGYSYCELFFSRVVKTYVERPGPYHDHRALFRAAPRGAIAAWLIFMLCLAALFVNATVGAIVWVVLAFAVAAVVYLAVYTLASIQYTREYHDNLIRAYCDQLGILSRFPETNPNPVLKLGIDGTCHYANPAARRMLGELGFPEDAVGEILPDNYQSLLVRCMTAQVDPRELEAERHGRVFTYTFSPFTDERSVIATGRDVTYLKEIERELRNMNENLEGIVQSRTAELRETQDVTILSLAGLAEIRDPETGKHLERTRMYVKALAEQLRDHPRFHKFLNDDTIEQLYKSAPLHDIGKVGVRDAILLKPASLSKEETEEMRMHTVRGGDTLRWAQEKLGFQSFLRIAQDIAYYHHERWDGGGYPFGLAGDDIPWSARLMALADVYDAFTTKRVYKEAFPHCKARAIIESERGKHFDPDVVDAFLALEGQFIAIAREYAE